ncbi:zinc finger, SWIM-type containing protein [Tanacetum coccineum]
MKIIDDNQLNEADLVVDAENNLVDTEIQEVDGLIVDIDEENLVASTVENSELVAMFWADEVDKCNYKEFGDIISFDATFQTNKFDMVFVPFTGIDNHRKCVTVGSGLLLREDTEAYTWLLRHFLRYGFLCRHVFCVLKNRDIQVILEKYILRRWRRDIIPPALRRNTNIYGEKNETIENLTNVANFVVDECLFLLGKDEGMLAKFVEQLKTIKKEVQVQVPKPPSQKTGYVIEDIYAVEKPQQNNVNNPQRAKTNKHTKSTCPSNPKYVAKLARLVAAAAEQGTKTAVEQATTNATAAEQGATIAAATEQATTTAIVPEEATNAS